jgi:hypothetical protein
MEFDNAINLDRKFGVRGTKKTGGALTIAFAIVEVSNRPLHKRPAKYQPLSGIYPI